MKLVMGFLSLNDNHTLAGLLGSVLSFDRSFFLQGTINIGILADPPSPGSGAKNQSGNHPHPWVGHT